MASHKAYHWQRAQALLRETAQPYGMHAHLTGDFLPMPVTQKSHAVVPYVLSLPHHDVAVLPLCMTLRFRFFTGMTKVPRFKNGGIIFCVYPSPGQRTTILLKFSDRNRQATGFMGLTDKTGFFADKGPFKRQRHLPLFG